MLKAMTVWLFSLLLVSFQAPAFGTALRLPLICGDIECKRIKYILPIVRVKRYEADQKLQKKLEESLRQALADVNEKWGGKYKLSSREYEKVNPTPRGHLSPPERGDMVYLSMNSAAVQIGGRQYVSIAFYLKRGNLAYNDTWLSFYPEVIDLEKDVTKQIARSLECNLSVHLNQPYFNEQWHKNKKQWAEYCGLYEKLPEELAK